MKKKRDQAIVGVLAVVLGLYLTFQGILMVMNAMESSDWPTAPGRITESVLEQRTRTSSNRSSQQEVYYVAKIRYVYKVDNAPYTGNRVSFTYGLTNLFNRSSQQVNKYPEGKAVAVSYNPDSPEVAVLEPEATGLSYLLFGVGILFSGAGGYTIVAYFLARKHIREYRGDNGPHVECQRPAARPNGE